MTRCAVPNCKSHLVKTCRYFCLPRDENRRKEWIKFSRRDPATIDPSKQYKFCEQHFEENHFELNRQDKWKKLKPNAIPSINFPRAESKNERTKKRKNQIDGRNSNNACCKQLKLDLSDIHENIPLLKRRTKTKSYTSTSETENVHSNLSIENVLIEEIFIDLDNENERLLKEGTTTETSASEIHKLRSENEKLRKENQQLRTTVVKMQKILARRRFTYLNVAALLQNRNKKS